MNCLSTVKHRIRSAQPTVLVVAMVAVLGSCGNDSEPEEADEPAALTDGKLLIEHNSTDEDTGFQGFADGDPWNLLTLGDAAQAQVLTVNPKGGLLDFGLTELFFETSEPENAEVPIEQVLARLSEGTYEFQGDMVDDDASSTTTSFRHRIPAGAELVRPPDGATGVDPQDTVIAWRPVTQDIHGASINIVGYQVIVEEDAPSEFPSGFARPLFSIFLPASATRVAIPVEFMEDDTCYSYEVLAIEESGNQTLASAAFETGTGCNNEDPPENPDPHMTEAKLLIEHNATDQDTGFQGFADGDPWNFLAIRGPGQVEVLTVNPKGGLFNFGLTELFFETSEPENAEIPIEQVLARLPAGTYSFSGDMVDGETSTVTTTLTHKIPTEPVLESPTDGATGIDPSNTVIAWQPVTQDIHGQAVEIVGYQVIVEEDVDPAFPQGFSRPLFSVHLPAAATSVRVPVEFGEGGKTYAYEVLAIEKSGNQTLSSATFSAR